MKNSIAASTLLALQIQSSAAFAPSTFIKPSAATSITQRSAVDPSIFADVHQHADTLSSFFSSINLADAADAAVEQAAAAPGKGGFGFLEAPIEFLLGAIHSALTGMGMSENSWGVTIIVMVVIIKAVTYPLTKQQLTSTNKMQVSLCFIVSQFVRYVTSLNSGWNGPTNVFFRICVKRVLCIYISTCVMLNHKCCHLETFALTWYIHHSYTPFHSIPIQTRLFNPSSKKLRPNTNQTLR